MLIRPLLALTRTFVLYLGLRVLPLRVVFSLYGFRAKNVRVLTKVRTSQVKRSHFEHTVIGDGSVAC